MLNSIRFVLLSKLFQIYFVFLYKNYVHFSVEMINSCMKKTIYYYSFITILLFFFSSCVNIISYVQKIHLNIRAEGCSIFIQVHISLSETQNPLLILSELSLHFSRLQSDKL